MIFFKRDKGGKGKKKQLTGEQLETEVRKLKDQLAIHLEKGKLDKALDVTRELIQLEPKDPEWRRKLADLYRTLKKPKEELAARTHAATLYAEAGFLLKGIAMCKMALALDPHHEATQKKLAELNGQAAPAEEKPAPGGSPFKKPHAQFGKRKAKPQPEAAEKPAASAPEPAAPEPIAAAPEPIVPAPEPPVVEMPEAPEAPPPSIPPGAPLDAVPLVSVVPELPTEIPDEPPVSVAPESDDEIYIVQLDAETWEDDEEEMPVESMELVDAEESVDDAELIDDSEAREAVKNALKRTPLLSDLNEDSFIQLVEAVEFRELTEGEVLFSEGDAADAMYAVAEGEVAASVERDHVVELARLGEGEFFGEIGLLAEQPRQATITATQPTQLLRFERDLVSVMENSEPEFIRILLRFVRERLVESLITTSPLFAPFAGGEAEDLTRRFRFLEVKSNKPLVKQGEASEGVFILLTGGAKVVQQDGEESRELSELCPGEIFGEMSLMHHEPAMATVMTTAKSYVLQLPANDFTQLIMMHPSVLAYVSTLASERQAQNAAGGEERLSLL